MGDRHLVLNISDATVVIVLRCTDLGSNECTGNRLHPTCILIGCRHGSLLGCSRLRVFRSATTRQHESDQPRCLQAYELRKSLDHVFLPQSVELPDRPRLAGCKFNACLAPLLRNPIPIVVHIGTMITNALGGPVKNTAGGHSATISDSRKTRFFWQASPSDCHCHRLFRAYHHLLMTANVGLPFHTR